MSIHSLPESSDLSLLVGQSGGGSEAEFAELVKRVHDRVLRWARRLTGDDDEADDVAQLVLVRLHKHCRSLSARRRFTSWLYQVTRNLVFERVRTERRRAALRAHEWTAADWSSETGRGAMEDVARLACLVHAYYHDLPNRQREVFELVDIRGRSPSEVAELLGIAPATVRVVLLKARRAIRTRMLAEHPRLLEDYLS